MANVMEEDQSFSLADLIETIYTQKGNQPVLLSQFGEELRSRMELPPGEKLSVLISRIPGFKIASSGPRLPAYILRDEQSLDGIDNPALLANFRRSLLYAFIKPKSEDSRVFYRTILPYGFVIRSTSPGAGYIEIPDTSRLESCDGQMEALAPKEKSLLKNNILAWAEEHKLPPNLIYHTRTEPAAELKNSCSNALERFILAQSDEALARMVLPGDIVKLLLQQR